MWGMKDPVIKPHYLDKFVSGFKNSEIVRLETSGHFPQEEQPKVITTLILNLLTDRNTN